MTQNKNQKYGYVLLWRSLLKKGWFKRPIAVQLWIYLLLQSSYNKNKEVMFGGKNIKLQPGQFTTGRKIMAKELSCCEKSIERWLELFENEGQVTQRTDGQCRLISINNWNQYQLADTTADTTADTLINKVNKLKNNKESASALFLTELKKRNLTNTQPLTQPLTQPSL